MERAVVVTGAAGLVGSRLVRLLAEQRDVVAVYRREPRVRHTGVAALVHDLTQPLPQELLTTAPEVVVHLAQSDLFRVFPDGTSDTFAVNAIAALRLLEWAEAAGARAFVYASTGGVYARSAHPIPESAVTATAGPGDAYLASKLAGELVTRVYSERMTTVIVRPFFVYGAGQRSSMLLPRMARLLKADTPVPLSGPDGFHFNPLHADDAARLIATALDRQHSTTINLAGPEVVSLRNVCERLAALMRVVPRFDVLPAQSEQDLVGDTATMTATLGPAQIPVTTGVADVLDRSEART